MIKNHRFRAFTIMELLVVLVLISIVLSSGALLYFQFNTYLESNLKQTNAENGVMLFNRAFRNDIHKPGLVLVNQNEIEISAGTGYNPIMYTFEETYIIRTNEISADTFFILSSNLEILGNPVSGEFEELSVHLNLGNISYPLFIRKIPENIDLFNKQ